MKSGLAVIALCLMVSGFMAYNMKIKMQTNLVGSQDLMLGLIYFMEQHEGRLPASEQEFRASPFVIENEDGSVRIQAPENTAYNPKTHGFTIADLAPFEVAWGRSLDDLIVDEYGRVRDQEHKAVVLARWPDSPPSGKGYSVILLATSHEIRSKNQVEQPDVHPTDAAE